MDGAPMTLARYTAPPTAIAAAAPATTGAASRTAAVIERRQTSAYAHVAPNSATSVCLNPHASRNVTPATNSAHRRSACSAGIATAIAAVASATPGMSGRIDMYQTPGSTQPNHVMTHDN